MKLVVLSLWPPTKSGTAIYSEKLYDSISEGKEKDIVVITSNNGTHRRMRVKKGWNPGPFSIFQALNKSIKERGNIYHIQFEFLTFGHPISILLLPLLIIGLRITRKKVIITTHCLISINYLSQIRFNQGDNRYINFFQRFIKFFYLIIVLLFNVIGLFSNKIIVHNQLMRDTLVREYGIKNNKIEIISHGVDKRKDVLKKNNDNPLKIFVFGFLRPSKGLEYLIESMLKLIQKDPLIQLIIAGSRSHQQDLRNNYSINMEKIVENLELAGNIFFLTKFIPQNELDYLISEADIIVLPYLDYFVEASGVLFRMMDYGKAIICTRIPKFISELNHGKNCIMVDPKNSPQLFNAIWILRNEKIRNYLGDNLKKKAAGRYWNNVAEKHIRLYESLIRGV
jgi:glycosyltransferase involved in cell wall biosynthesis